MCKEWKQPRVLLVMIEESMERCRCREASAVGDKGAVRAKINPRTCYFGRPLKTR